MEGCTRVLPLIALKVGKVDSRAQAPGKMDAAEAEGESSRRPGVSPNRHPEARTGAANLKVRESGAFIHAVHHCSDKRLRNIAYFSMPYHLQPSC